MKKMLFVTPEENIEMTYPDFLEHVITMICREIKLKSVPKLKNKSEIRTIIIDELVKSDS